VSSPLRLAFMGSPDFSVPALRTLHAAGHEIAAVYCQPPKPAGRGQKETPCPVHRAALELGLPVRHPARLKRDEAEHAAFAALDLDVAVVAAYGLILPKAMLDAPRRGCLNIHASLLPRWRGAAPIHRAVQAGDERSGVTIMQMDEGLDTGPMLLKEDLCLAAEETTASLHDRLAAMGARLIVETLELAACGGLHPVPQPAEGVTYAHKIDKAESPLDWTQPATVLARRIRAFDPFPGATCRHGDEVIKVWKATVVQGDANGAPPGSVLAISAAGVDVACGEGVLRVQQMQRPGGRRLPASAVAQSLTVVPGDRLAS